MNALPILNISTYRFVPLDDLPALRQRLFDTAQARGLLGTVLIAAEGINLFIAGPHAAVNDWLQLLREDPRFADLPAKESESATVPFKRLKVKIKDEIIRMNMPVIQPTQGRAPAISAATLAIRCRGLAFREVQRISASLGGAPRRTG